MRIKEAKIVLQDFVITKSEISINVNEEDRNRDISKDDIHIPIEMDYNIAQNVDYKNIFKITLTTKGNNIANKKTGYVFSIVSDGFFIIKEKDCKEDNIDKMLIRTAIPMMLSSIRMYILNLTSYGPFGRYILPSIDLIDFYQKFLKKRNIEK